MCSAASERVVGRARRGAEEWGGREKRDASDFVGPRGKTRPCSRAGPSAANAQCPGRSGNFQAASARRWLRGIPRTACEDAAEDARRGREWQPKTTQTRFWAGRRCSPSHPFLLPSSPLPPGGGAARARRAPLHAPVRGHTRSRQRGASSASNERAQPFQRPRMRRAGRRAARLGCVRERWGKRPQSATTCAARPGAWLATQPEAANRGRGRAARAHSLAPLSPPALST